MTSRGAILSGLVAAALLIGGALFALRRGEPEHDAVPADTTRSAPARDTASVNTAATRAPESLKVNTPPAGDTTAKKPPATSTQGSPTNTSSSRPHLIRAIPGSAVLTMGAAVEVEVRGTGFTPTENSILFGTLNGGTVASVNGTSIRFIVPTEYPAHGEVPPMAVQPGAYPIVVRNKNGTSDTLTFTLRSGAP